MLILHIMVKTIASHVFFILCNYAIFENRFSGGLIKNLNKTNKFQFKSISSHSKFKVPFISNAPSLDNFQEPKADWMYQQIPSQRRGNDLETKTQNYLYFSCFALFCFFSTNKMIFFFLFLTKHLEEKV